MDAPKPTSSAQESVASPSAQPPSSQSCSIEMFRQFLDLTPGGIFRYKADDVGEFDFVNLGMIEMLGCSSREDFDEWTGGVFEGIIHPEDKDFVLKSIDEQIKDSNHDKVRYRLRRKDDMELWVDDRGHFVIDEDGTEWFYVTVLDVTEAMHFRHELIRANSLDNLTNLLNRGAAKKLIEEYLETEDTPFSMFLVDIDDFKNVNDTYGHPVGDSVLIDLADFLRQSVRRHDVVARLGGDEFLIFASGLGPGDAFDRIVDHLSRGPFMKERHSDKTSGLKPTISVGIVTSSKNELTFDMLYQAADKLLYDSKKNGKSGVVTGTI